MARARLRRILLERVLSRPFTLQATLLNGRPQLPFLSVPATPPQRVRLFTTERKQWIKFEVYLALRYTATICAAALCAAVIYVSVNEELTERRHPTPHEWRFLTRVRMRGALSEVAEAETAGIIDWVRVMVSSLDLVKRLEDPEGDGVGLRHLMDGEPLSVDGIGRAGYDITAKSENWQRGYYEALMLLARAAEHLDGWVVDKTRKIVFPPAVVIGDSNPHPQPIPPGAASAPREEDCEVAYEPAENIYLRILTTRGFRTRQKMDAALSYATFLEFKQLPDAATQMYEWAVSLANEGSPRSLPQFDARTYVLNDTATSPSMNLLDALTALAEHKARTGDVSSALPMFLSLLRARRLLPKVEPAERDFKRRMPRPSIVESLRKFTQQQPYPPPPNDGTSTPVRDARNACQESALQLHVGEILYSLPGGANREEGLSWTRDAVDAAEEQLRGLSGDATATAPDDDVQAICRQCLGAGLENWAKMVARLAREEEARKTAASAAPSTSSGSSFFAFWSRPGDDVPVDRWAAEQKVVEERTRRTLELMENLKPEPRGLSSWLKA